MRRWMIVSRRRARGWPRAPGRDGTTSGGENPGLVAEQHFPDLFRTFADHLRSSETPVSISITPIYFNNLPKSILKSLYSLKQKRCFFFFPLNTRSLLFINCLNKFDQVVHSETFFLESLSGSNGNRIVQISIAHDF